MPLVIQNDECPVYAYINSLRAVSSKSTALRVLHSIAQKLGRSNYYSINWARFDRNTLNSLVALLKDKGLSYETIGLYLSITKSVLREAFLLGQINSLHWERVKSVKPPMLGKKKLHATLSQSDFAQLLNTIEVLALTNTKKVRDQAMFHLLIGCGLRRFELAKLKLSAIDLIGNKITFDGKGGKERTVAIHPITMRALKEWMVIRGYKEGAVFTRVYKSGELHKSVSINNTDEIPHFSSESIYLLCKTYGLVSAGITPHSLRRSYATWLSRNGANIQHISKLMGHYGIKTTEIYIKTEQREIDKTVLDKLFV